LGRLRGGSVGSVTKKDIVRTIAEQIDLPQLRTKELVQRTFDALIEALVREGRVELRNFGVFQIKRREARVARNPRTGERVPVQAKSVVTFKPGKEMEARVREFDRRRDAGDAPEAPPSAPNTTETTEPGQPGQG
jgi:DNA-binding protein HU-beta/integration host factor subunit beta